MNENPDIPQLYFENSCPARVCRVSFVQPAHPTHLSTSCFTAQ